ncbi:MAG: pantoate--beta-alanine ligase [Methylophilaceae bacterium]|nr:MAG: pantoate--beta-alanine ligase [Methylophilaceae bacterium]
MQIVHTSAALKNCLKDYAKIALVPTMGNLHAGHLQLVELAKQQADCVVVSIFVNPLQFDSLIDLEKYPRTLVDDCKRLEQVGASIVFVPSVEEMYPDFDGQSLNQSMMVTPPPIAAELCGASRPGHFTGVTTVVAKLFHMVQPDIAIFGKKDFQQLFIIRELVKQLNFAITIIAGDIVREASGLAMSSRNGHFNTHQATQAAQLNHALRMAVKHAQSSNIDYSTIETKTAEALIKQGWQIDYISIRDALSLKPATKYDTQLVILAAATLANVRLIDNIEFCAKPFN